ncbi:HupE/UreJ family protein [Thalassovita taeanensis]|uniref:Urease accessory protein n=1 Tax=Thalassovita taeanensis TaxID=657014 RepID=A0A1H9FDS2_9RHOB|nr:HupE/UreJ family protein [Thalassovita taeanensis]SEQ36064.1 urease accessory protein [Thalassovita taeanensis]
MKPIFTIFAIFAASPALAHLDPGAHGSVAAGLSHPLFGADHILAMLVVGLWAAQIGGRAVWSVPAGFVGTMLAGFALSLTGVVLPMVEPMILASSVALGLLVAMAVRPDAWLATGVVALFALFHGYAHGAELGGADAAAFGTGFALATAGLHGLGIGIGLLVRNAGLTLRILGGGTAIAGLALTLA